MGRGGAVRRQGAWRTGARVRRQPAASGCFNFIYRFSKLRNSKILNATQKSPKSKVVEEL
jgi:hypothetical protein